MPDVARSVGAGSGGAGSDTALASLLGAAVPEVASAAVAAIAVDGEIVAQAAAGELVRYADASETLVPVRPPAGLDSLFDLASVTKLYTSVVVLSLVEEGRLDLDAPVATWLPEHYADRPGVTLRRLLTHTAGLPPSRRVEKEPPGEARWTAVLSTPARCPLGTRYVYSDVGMITVGRIAEIAGGAPLDVLVRDRVTEPLGARDTMYRPDPTMHPRSAATEHMPDRVPPLPPVAASSGPVPQARPTGEVAGTSGADLDLRTASAVRDGSGCVRGEVHDETAHALGGVAGHAGLFATAGDVLRFGEMLRTGGGGIVSPDAIAEMTRDHGVTGVPFRHGLGIRIGDPAIVGPLPDAFGHSGFTGTSLIVDVRHRLTAVLLTNNVHPLRGRQGIRDLRHAVAREALRLAED